MAEVYAVQSVGASCPYIHTLECVAGVAHVGQTVVCVATGEVFSLDACVYCGHIQVSGCTAAEGPHYAWCPIGHHAPGQERNEE